MLFFSPRCVFFAYTYFIRISTKICAFMRTFRAIPRSFTYFFFYFENFQPDRVSVSDPFPQRLTVWLTYAHTHTITNHIFFYKFKKCMRTSIEDVVKRSKLRMWPTGGMMELGNRSAVVIFRIWLFLIVSLDYLVNGLAAWAVIPAHSTSTEYPRYQTRSTWLVISFSS